MKESLELFSRTMNENPEVKEFLNGDKEITFKPIIDLTGSTCNNTYYDKEAFQKALTDKDNVPPQKIMIIGDNNHLKTENLLVQLGMDITGVSYEILDQFPILRRDCAYSTLDLPYDKVRFDKHDLITQFLNSSISDELSNELNLPRIKILEGYEQTDFSVTNAYYRKLINKLSRTMGYKDNKKRKKRMFKKRQK